MKTPQQSSFFLHFFKDFRSSKSCMIRFRIKFPEIYFKNSLTLSYPPKFTSKSKKLTICSKICCFSLITHKKIHQFNEKNAEMLLVCFFRYLYGNNSYCYSKQLMVICFSACFCVCFHLFGSFKFLKVFFYRIHHNNLNEHQLCANSEQQIKLCSYCFFNLKPELLIYSQN